MNKDSIEADKPGDWIRRINPPRIKFLQKVTAELGEWQKHIITKQQVKNGEIPHPAAAPISTDQEAGGQVSTPEGNRKYDTQGPNPIVQSEHQTN